jgi:DNA-binding transcriptional regulator YhcF (GntR family)
MRSWKLSDAVKVDGGRATPAHLQIARALEAAIVSGKIAPGTRLPTVREIAVTVGVTTSIVQRAMAELAAAGIVMGQGSAGTYVSDDLDGISTVEERTRRFARQTLEDIDRLGYDRATVAHLINPKRDNT